MKTCIIVKKPRFFLLLISIITIGSVFLFCSKSKSPNNKKAESSEASQHKTSLVQNAMAATNESVMNAVEAMATAQRNSQYLLLLFYNQKDASLQEMEAVVTDFQNSASQKIQLYKALTTDIKETDIINKYGINRAPLPITLVVAPNGAITGGFPQQITHAQLEKSIVPELTMKILKSVQANKVALVLFKNNKTTFNNEVTKAAKDFSMDARLKGVVDIIEQNPWDAEIKEFLDQCQIDNRVKEATVALIVPPGRIGGVYSGNITKDTIIAGLAACSAGSGCCGPR